jgi:hypothetical protein
LACGLAGCGGKDNDLKGSMSQVYSLKFDEVQILRGGEPGKEEVSIEYLRMSGKQIDAWVAKLTVQVGDLANLAGNEISLTEKGPDGLPRGTLQRIESTTTDFPLKLGNVQFDQEPLPETNLSGHFYTTVITEVAERTLNGDFKAKVEAR